MLNTACSNPLLAPQMTAAPTTPTTSDKAPRARLEPVGGTYFYVNMNWGEDSAAASNKRLGTPTAVYVKFFHFPSGSDDVVHLDDFIDQVRDQHGLALLILEPAVSLDDITSADATTLADLLRTCNERGGPVFMRFAHEMNGSFYPWSQQPSVYMRLFRLITEEVHARTTHTAMLWAPNYGSGGPFTGGKYEAKPGTRSFELLDTNGDGCLSQSGRSTR